MIELDPVKLAHSIMEDQLGREDSFAPNSTFNPDWVGLEESKLYEYLSELFPDESPWMEKFRDTLYNDWPEMMYLFIKKQLEGSLAMQEHYRKEMERYKLKSEEYYKELLPFRRKFGEADPSW